MCRNRLVVLPVAACLFLAGCDNQTQVAPAPAPSGSPFSFSTSENENPSAEGGQLASLPRFEEMWPHVMPEYRNGEQGKSIMVEAVGGGAGWLDFDRDGVADLYFCQGGDPTKPASPEQPNDVFLRGLLSGGFAETPAELTGLYDFNYSQGVAVGDYDNDGFDDIYVTNVGKNTLWRNQGDGTFENVTESSGTQDTRWSSSAAWGDIDQDGDLDLYVCNYLIYDPLNPIECRTRRGEHRICHPKDLDPCDDACFINQGDGTFVESSQELGLFGEGGKGLGVAIADFNNDKLPDIYVANDTTANFLFVNQGDGTFLEQAQLLGCAVDRVGSFQASMGLGIADVDHNGYLDIYISHFKGESNTLYRNFGVKGFQDVTAIDGLQKPTESYLGFGLSINDYDLDGHLNIFIANGHVENYPGNPDREMYAQILTHDGSSWHQTQQEAGSYFEKKRVGRGVAIGDADRDGAPDVLVIHQNLPACLLKSQHIAGHWLKVAFNGRESNRRGIGCRVTIKDEAGKTRMQELSGGTTFASTHESVLFFGLGETAQLAEVDVLWPSGQTQTLKDVPADQFLVLTEPK